MRDARTRGKGKVVRTKPAQQELVVLAADKNTKEAVEGLIVSRSQAIGIRQIAHSIITHPQHDPGCLNQSADLLSVFRRTHRHALVIFDHEGSGREEVGRADLEAAVEAALRAAGWDDRAAAVVIDPELENWVWGTSPHVAHCLGWNNPAEGIREWLVGQNLLAAATQIKPERPKEAMEAVLRSVRKPRSSSIYRTLAEKVSLAHCTDPAFGKLCATLRAWFPILSP